MTKRPPSGEGLTKVIMVKAQKGFRKTPTVKYRSRRGDWFTHSPVVRPCVHKEWLVDKGRAYVDPGYRVNDKEELEGREFDLFTKQPVSDEWKPLTKKAREFLDAVLACEPVVVTYASIEPERRGHRDGYVDVWEIANPRVTDEGLCFDLVQRIEWCAQ